MLPDRTSAQATGGALSGRYPLWLCDVWGVVHDGIAASRDACTALQNHRSQGGTAILITNAPRPSSAILPQLAALKVPEDCYDAIVSSGDVTRRLVDLRAGVGVYHLGPEKDLALLEGLSVRFTAADDADVVLCSGLLDDKTEQPQDYDEMLSGFAARGLAMICANPDKVVRFGERLLPCAGALAERYEAMGGTVEMAGKPHAPIYQEALRLAAEAAGRTFSKSACLAIGDGMATDAAGAGAFGIDLLFIVNGIHEKQFLGSGADGIARDVSAKVPGVRLAGIASELRW